ncbi:DNA cytosine methyltransferase [Acinetobacter sp. ANC 4204]|uniref:DNA cytosine methyltransferase n=1 Tax=Acinetobacter sp. ANC 4204 TaxID=1977884 RepID=UPI000A34E8CC|nr:DNA cytosine methyltransferase [Acinetobacter sp. ANC 4204]OTG58844.1 DNA cytosine methyltransferase [Acinetobacter sp. ANC 4204]
MNELALFAGAGGGILGSHLMGWRTVCAVEREAYPAQVLAQRQNDGILPPFPIWSDVLSFDGKPWRGIVDVISGGFPCQDISSAGKGAGIDGARSGMWSQMARIIGEVRPRFVFVENSPMLVSRGLARVISDLAKMGYDAQWARLSASNFGAPHQRDRLWIVAYSKSIGCETKNVSSRLPKGFTWVGNISQYVANTQSFGLEQTRESIRRSTQRFSGSSTERSRWWAVEPGLGRVADGVANRVDRLKATGNGQVSIVAVNAYEFLR